jgi:glycine/D-amino acid oxidase-like deaminating enzyme
MLHKIDTVIVGGGQAGLAISYYLTQEGREHVALERAPAVANAWRNQRWDSFTLVTPNLQVRPGCTAEDREFCSVSETMLLIWQHILPRATPSAGNTTRARVSYAM